MSYTGSATVSNPTSGSAGQTSDRQIVSPQAWADLMASGNAGAGVAIGTRSVKALVVDGTGNQVVAPTAGSLSVSGASGFTGLATFSGHLALGGTGPTVTAAAGAGAGPTIITTGSHDQGIAISFTAGVGPSSGAILNVSFGTTFATAPKVVQVVAMNDKASELAHPFYADAASITTGGFTIKCSTAPTSGDTYKLGVFVV